jgi:hypothetical protein
MTCTENKLMVYWQIQFHSDDIDWGVTCRELEAYAGKPCGRNDLDNGFYAHKVTKKHKSDSRILINL